MFFKTLLIKSTYFLCVSKKNIRTNLKYVICFSSEIQLFLCVVVRLKESLYTVKSIKEYGMHLDYLNRLQTGADNSCLPAGIHDAKWLDVNAKPKKHFSERVSNRSIDSTLSGYSLYVDSEISKELQNKVNIEFHAGKTFIMYQVYLEYVLSQFTISSF